MAVDDGCQCLGCGKDDAHGDLARGDGAHGDLARGDGAHGDLARSDGAHGNLTTGHRRHPCLGCDHDAHRGWRSGNLLHGCIRSDDGGERHGCVEDVLREFRRFGDNRHAGAMLWPHLPEIGRVLPQGAGGFFAEDGRRGGLALRDVAEGEAVAQAFVEDVLLRFGDQPRRDLLVVNRRAE